MRHVLWRPAYGIVGGRRCPGRLLADLIAETGALSALLMASGSSSRALFMSFHDHLS